MNKKHTQAKKTKKARDLYPLFLLSRGMAEGSSINWKVAKQKLNTLRVVFAEQAEYKVVERRFVDAFKAIGKKNETAFKEASDSIQKLIEERQGLKIALSEEVDSLTGEAYDKRLQAAVRRDVKECLPPALKELWAELEAVGKNPDKDDRIRKDFVRATLLRGKTENFFDYLKMLEKLRSLRGF